MKKHLLLSILIMLALNLNAQHISLFDSTATSVNLITAGNDSSAQAQINFEVGDSLKWMQSVNGFNNTQNDGQLQGKLSFSHFDGSNWHSSMVMDTAGSIGIGTSMPEAMLHIIHINEDAHHLTGGSTFIIGPTNQSDQAHLRMGVNEGYSWIQAHGSKPLAINPIGNNVGIGTENPEYPLDVVGNIRIRGNGSGNPGKLYFYSSSSTQDNLIHSYNENNHKMWSVVLGDRSKADNFAIDHPNNNIYHEFVIDTLGNVGIGTQSPSAKFQVNSIRPILIKNNGGHGVYGSEIGFNAILNTGVVPNKFIKLGETLQQGGAVQVVDKFGNMYFQMYDAGTQNESIINYNPHIKFSNTGQVGIGITSIPSGYKLAVDGKIICEELRVRLSQDWPDYVFDENYHLPTLSEVQRHIKKEKCLPGIPNAAQMEAEGMEVGEMQSMMMQKIEELTLYIIEQDKKISQLQQQLLKLEGSK